MFFYHRMLKISDGINHAVSGNFCGLEKTEIIVSRGRNIEILCIYKAENSKTETLKSLLIVDINARILSLEKVQGLKKDYVAVGSDSGMFMILGYNLKKNCFKIVKEHFIEKNKLFVTPRFTPGQFLAVDPQSKAVALAAIEQNLLFYALCDDHNKLMTISTKNEARCIFFDVISVFSVTGMPTFAFLEVQSKEIVSPYPPDLEINDENLENVSNPNPSIDDACSSEDDSNSSSSLSSNCSSYSSCHVSNPSTNNFNNSKKKTFEMVANNVSDDDSESTDSDDGEEQAKRDEKELPPMMLRIYKWHYQSNKMFKYAIPLSRHANKLVSVPPGDCHKGGILICYSNRVDFLELETNKKVCSFLPYPKTSEVYTTIKCEMCTDDYTGRGADTIKAHFQRHIDIAYEKMEKIDLNKSQRDLLISGSAVYKNNGKLLIFLQSEEGDLYSINIEKENECLKMNWTLIDTLPVASAMCILEDNYLFLAADYGDHILYKIEPFGSDDELLASNNTKLHKENSLLSRKEAYSLKTLTELPNLTPLTNCIAKAHLCIKNHLAYIELTEQSYVRSLSCVCNKLLQFHFTCGQGSHSTLRTMIYGAEVKELKSTELPSKKPDNMWIYTKKTEDGSGTYLILTFSADNKMLVLSMKEDIIRVESNEKIIKPMNPNVECDLLLNYLNFDDNSSIQVFTYGIRYSFEEDKIEWRTFRETNEESNKTNEESHKTKESDKTSKKSEKTKESERTSEESDKTKESDKTNEESDVSQHFKQCTVHLSAIYNNQIAVVLSTKELVYMEVLKSETEKFKFDVKRCEYVPEYLAHCMDFLFSDNRAEILAVCFDNAIQLFSVGVEMDDAFHIMLSGICSEKKLGLFMSLSQKIDIEKMDPSQNSILEKWTFHKMTKNNEFFKKIQGIDVFADLSLSHIPSSLVVCNSVDGDQSISYLIIGYKDGYIERFIFTHKNKKLWISFKLNLESTTAIKLIKTEIDKEEVILALSSLCSWISFNCRTQFEFAPLLHIKLGCAIGFHSKSHPMVNLIAVSDEKLVYLEVKRFPKFVSVNKQQLKLTPRQSAFYLNDNLLILCLSDCKKPFDESIDTMASQKTMDRVDCSSPPKKKMKYVSEVYDGKQYSKYNCFLCVYDPMKKEFISQLKLTENESIFKMCDVKFSSRPKEWYLLAIVKKVYHKSKVTLKPLSFIPVECIESYLVLLKLNKDFKFEKVCSYQTDFVAEAVCSFAGRVLVGVNDKLCLFNLTCKNSLVMEATLKMPCKISAIYTKNDRFIVLCDNRNVLYGYLIEANKGSELVMLCEDQQLTKVSALCFLSDAIIVAADVYGYLNVVLIPAIPEQNQEFKIPSQIRKYKEEYESETNEPPLIDEYSFMQHSYVIAKHYVGEIVTSLQVTTFLRRSRYLVLYSTLSGAVGYLVPFFLEEPSDILSELQFLIKGKSQFHNKDSTYYPSEYENRNILTEDEDQEPDGSDSVSQSELDNMKSTDKPENSSCPISKSISPEDAFIEPGEPITKSKNELDNKNATRNVESSVSQPGEPITESKNEFDDKNASGEVESSISQPGEPIVKSKNELDNKNATREVESSVCQPGEPIITKSKNGLDNKNATDEMESSICQPAEPIAKSKNELDNKNATGEVENSISQTEELITESKNEPDNKNTTGKADTIGEVDSSLNQSGESIAKSKNEPDNKNRTGEVERSVNQLNTFHTKWPIKECSVVLEKIDINKLHEKNTLVLDKFHTTSPIKECRVVLEKLNINKLHKKKILVSDLICSKSEIKYQTLNDKHETSEIVSCRNGADKSDMICSESEIKCQTLNDKHETSEIVSCRNGADKSDQTCNESEIKCQTLNDKHETSEIASCGNGADKSDLTCSESKIKCQTLNDKHETSEIVSCRKGTDKSDLTCSESEIKCQTLNDKHETSEIVSCRNGTDKSDITCNESEIKCQALNDKHETSEIVSCENGTDKPSNSNIEAENLDLSMCSDSFIESEILDQLLPSYSDVESGNFILPVPVVDGNLCDLFHTLSKENQKDIADKLGLRPYKICEALAELKARIYFEVIDDTDDKL